MPEKTFTMTLTTNEIAAVALCLSHTSAEIAFDECGRLSDIIPANYETLDELSKKFWEIYRGDKGK